MSKPYTEQVHMISSETWFRLKLVQSYLGKHTDKYKRDDPTTRNIEMQEQNKI